MKYYKHVLVEEGKVAKPGTKKTAIIISRLSG